MFQSVLRVTGALAATLFLSATSIAQVAPGSERHGGSTPRPAYLRLGVGTAYDIEGYYRTKRISLEYAPTLSKYFGAAGRVVGVFGTPTDGLEKQAPNQNYKAGYVEVEGIYYPFGTDKRLLFGVGAGGFGGYYRKNSFNFLQGTAGQLTDYGLRSAKGIHAGYLLSLNLDVALGASRNWRIGAKSTMQNGVGGNTTTSTHSLTFARKF